MRSALVDWGLGHEAPALELAVSELVTNALQHGRGDVEVEITATDDGVRLEVGDHGDQVGLPAITPAGPGTHGGWGLRLVERLSDSWGVVADRSATRVWMVRHAGGRSHGDASPTAPAPASAEASPAPVSAEASPAPVSGTASADAAGPDAAPSGVG